MASEIIERVAAFLKRSRIRFDVIVPVPPSGNRPVQPVLVLATGIGKALKLAGFGMCIYHEARNATQGRHGSREAKRIVGRTLQSAKGPYEGEEHSIV